MQAASSVACLASNIQPVGTVRLQARMRGGREIFRNIRVAFSACLGTDELGSWDLRRHDHDAVHGDARNQRAESSENYK